MQVSATLARKNIWYSATVGKIKILLLVLRSLMPVRKFVVSNLTAGSISVRRCVMQAPVGNAKKFPSCKKHARAEGSAWWCFPSTNENRAKTQFQCVGLHVRKSYLVGTNALFPATKANVLTAKLSSSKTVTVVAPTGKLNATKPEVSPSGVIASARREKVVDSTSAPSSAASSGPLPSPKTINVSTHVRGCWTVGSINVRSLAMLGSARNVLLSTHSRSIVLVGEHLSSLQWFVELLSLNVIISVISWWIVGIDVRRCVTMESVFVMRKWWWGASVDLKKFKQGVVGKHCA